MGVGNALNISESGFVTFDGVSVFKGRTLIAGTGISITNPDGVAGDPTISASATSNNFVIFTPLTGPIDFTSVQTFLVYTPASDFYLQSMIIKGTNIVNLIIGASVSVGINNPTYDNLISINSYSPNNSNTFETFTVTTTDSVLVPSGTPIYINISGGATADFAIGSVFLTGVLF